jgi:hypothetical protein
VSDEKVIPYSLEKQKGFQGENLESLSMTGALNRTDDLILAMELEIKLCNDFYERVSAIMKTKNSL